MDEVTALKEALESTLSSSVLSFDSLYGLGLIIGIAVLIILIAKRIIKHVSWIIAFVLFVEVMHLMAYGTELGDMLPILRIMFKYDVLTSLAQLCVGTPIADGLLYAQAWLNTTIGTAVSKFIGWIGPFFTSCASSAKI